MKVKVELSASQDLKGMKSIIEQWEHLYQMGKLVAISCYGSLDIQLLMPDQTTVTPPQLVDATGTVEP